MILVNSELYSGVTTRQFNLPESIKTGSSGNYWVDWAKEFTSLCESVLGLEVEKGPGTSVGIIQTNYGPSRYQYDCDWTQIDGRVPEHDFLEKGFTLWEGIDVWDVNYSNNDTGEDDATSISFLYKGIDEENKRFDFIVWFTTESNDTRNNKTGERLGLRFKYPLTNERGYNCAYYISASPCCIPWKKVDTTVNNECLLKYWTNINGRTGYISTATGYDNSLIQLRGYQHTYPTAAFTQEPNYNWAHYSETDVDENTQLYSSLGSTYQQYVPNIFRLNDNNLKLAEIICSKTLNTIDLRIKDANDRIAIDILFGNLMTEELLLGDITINSFVGIQNNNSGTYMFKYLITENNNMPNVPKQVNRPTNIDQAQQSYCGINRLLLQKETIHCEDLYQVFSFSNLMNEEHYYVQTFIDKNDINHDFILFNYGWGESSTIRQTMPALAIPI